MPDYCDECFSVKDELCPTCGEEFICGNGCEDECLRCALGMRETDPDELRPEDDFDE